MSRTFTVRLSKINFLPFLLGLILFAIFWAGIEVLASREWVRLALPPGSLGVDTRGGEFDSKMALLSSFNRQKPVDCVILGDSMVDYGVNPQVLVDEIKQKTGQDYRCFNFGLRWNTNQNSATLAGLLTRMYRLKLVVVGTSPMSYFSNNTMLRGLKDLPWVRYQMGEFSVEGWLVDHLAFYRYLLMAPKANLSIYQSPMKEYETKCLDGFEGYQSTMKIPVKSREPYKEYTMEEKDIDGFRDIAALGKNGVRVIVFDVPFHPNDYPLFVKGGLTSYENLYLTPMRKVVGDSGLTLIELYPDVPAMIPENGWLDHIHMNRTGANSFSKWLGGQLGGILAR